jgi:phage terminase Nu1 subunit (DNA packaging protein)
VLISRPPGTLAAERARLLAEQADRAARINRQESGELLPAVAVAREWAGICTGIRAALLAIPARLAAAHPGHPAMIADLERELRDALAELAEDAL